METETTSSISICHVRASGAFRSYPTTLFLYIQQDRPHLPFDDDDDLSLDSLHVHNIMSTRLVDTMPSLLRDQHCSG